MSRETLLVLLLASALVGLAALLGRPLLTAGGPVAGLHVPWWLLAAGFAATELVVLHIQVKREAQTVSVSELPLVLGLFFASPLDLVAGRLLGSAAVLLLHRRSPPLKTAFNLALVAAETALSLAVFRGLADGSPGGASPLTWAAAYAAVLLANALGAVAIGLVIAVYERGLRLLPLLREAVTGQAAAPMVVTLALVAVNSLSVSLASAVLLAAAGGMLLVAYRAYASLSDRHLSLERLYRFSQAVSSSPETDEVLRSVLDEAKELLRSDHAEIAFVAAGGSAARVRLGSSGRLTRSEGPGRPEDGWLVRTVVDDGEPLLMPRTVRDPDARGWLDAQGLREAVAVPLRGGAGIVGVLVVADRQGEVRTYEHDDVLLLETVGNHASVALQNGQLIDKLRHEALHDALTGLPNRVQLQRGLAAALDDLRDGRVPGAAVMILDLDGFKDVNDTLGHQHGDLLLVEVAKRLGTAVGERGLVARLGGDEFAVLLPGTAEEEHVLRVARRVLGALEEPIPLDGLEVAVGGSLGVALAPRHASEPAVLLKRADMAMYDAKASGRSLRLYESDLDTNNPRRLTLVPELRSALQGEDIEVYVQPKASLATGAVVGVEALVRWRHPELGQVPPDEFIPVAERSGLIGPLTTRVLETSLAAAAQWRATGLDLGVAVNLSTRSLLDADLVDEVRRSLRRHGVPGHGLTLEITESSVMADPARAVGLLHELRELGVRLSVDDFGTGYSSLSYLKRLPVHEVKIDRSFVMGLGDGSDDVAIVRSIVDLGRHLGLEVVAEGVEDQATWELLASIQCDLAQGWYLSRPVPVSAFPAWLAEREARRAPGLRVAGRVS